MKHTSIRLDEDNLRLVKHETERLGISMNQLINILLSLELPLDESYLYAYFCMKSSGKESANYDNRRN